MRMARGDWWGQTDERLNDETGKGSGDEDERHKRSRETEGDEVWRSCRTEHPSCVIQCPGRGIWLLTVGHFDGPQHLNAYETDCNGREARPRGSEDFSDACPLCRALGRCLIGRGEGTEARHFVVVAAMLYRVLPVRSRFAGMGALK